MTQRQAGGFLEEKQRVTYSLLRAAARVGLRLQLPLKQLTSLVEMAYFQEARETRGLPLEAIAKLFGKSLRTVSTLHHRFRGDFFAPEQELALRRAIAALVSHAPADLPRLKSAFPEVSQAELAVALQDLEREGTVVAEAGVWRRNPDAHEFFGRDAAGQIDGLNRQLDVVADTVWHRLVAPGDGPSTARSYVFRASDEDFGAIIDAIQALIRERAIAADDACDETEGGRRVGITFAAAPMSEETP